MGGLQACPQPTFLSSALPTEMPMKNRHLVYDEGVPFDFAPFYINESEQAYWNRWAELGRWSGLLCKPNATPVEAAISRNYELFKEMLWAEELAMIDLIQRFGPRFVSRATMGLSKVQRMATARLHILTIAGQHGWAMANKVETAERSGCLLYTSPSPRDS